MKCSNKQKLVPVSRNYLFDNVYTEHYDATFSGNVRDIDGLDVKDVIYHNDN